MLTENPDAFAKKMRILKFEILGLRRNNIFSPEKYANFYLTSPATIMAKKRFCIDQKINYKKNHQILRYTWITLYRKLNPSISKKEADKLGKDLTIPYKQDYDKWMNEYKKWAKGFAQRRGRRLIRKV